MAQIDAQIMALQFASRTQLPLVLFTTNIVGAVIAAGILGVSIGLLVRRHALLFGAIVGLVGASMNWWLVGLPQSSTLFVDAMRVGELLAFVASCGLSAVISAVARHRVAA